MINADCSSAMCYDVIAFCKHRIFTMQSFSVLTLLHEISYPLAINSKLKNSCIVPQCLSHLPKCANDLSRWWQSYKLALVNYQMNGKVSH